MADTLADALRLARANLDDPNAQEFTDNVLRPFAVAAYRQLQGLLYTKAGVTYEVKTTVLTVPAGTLELTEQSNPALPGDLVAPHHLWEKTSGSSEKFIDMEMAPEELPDSDQTLRLRTWAWEDNKILFIGATQKNDVKLRYEKTLPVLAKPSDPLAIRGCLNALAFMTAAQTAKIRGNANLASSLTADANTEIRNLIVSFVKPRQRTGVRRQPYGGARRRLYI